MNNEKKIQFGCVADDFTGASDAASFLAKKGVSTILYNGIPDSLEDLEKADAVVIALKCRTQETSSAIKEVIEAFHFLKKIGANQLYYKYCSTFDSTKEGNIGPVMDAALEEFGISYTILCPSLLINNRVVKDGILYVEGVPLEDTHMRNHPLTPMRQSRVKKLMEMQSKYPVFELNSEQLSHSEDIEKLLEKLAKEHKHFYLVPDYYKDEHGSNIVEIFKHLPILSGGSGLLEHIALTIMNRKIVNSENNSPKRNDDQAILLAGSCSKMTLDQIKYFQESSGLSYQIQPLELSAGSQTIIDIQNFLAKNHNFPVLVYSSAEPAEIDRVKAAGIRGIDDLLEKTMAEIAKFALESGRTRIIVAGGETSGAVTKHLGFSSYHIGKSVAPGVPVMTPIQNERVKLVLKSGNFGQQDFFLKALRLI